MTRSIIFIITGSWNYGNGSEVTGVRWVAGFENRMNYGVLPLIRNIISCDAGVDDVLNDTAEFCIILH